MAAAKSTRTGVPAPPPTPPPTSFNDGEMVGDWTIESKLGEGGFGAVYKVFNKNKQYYALKVEDEKATVRILKMDVTVLCEMGRKRAKHFCRLRDTGNARGVNFMVMTLVGQSLNDLRRMMPNSVKHFTLPCALLIGVQCIEAIEELHSSGFLHRDIKGGNFTIGRNTPKFIYMIDFGMCRKFVDKEGVRRPRWSSGFRGTLQYAPISCHIQREQSRKDDLESWLYTQVEFTNGDVPWRRNNKPDEVLKMKMDIRDPEKNGTFYASCPRLYIETMEYIDGLFYYDVPDYTKMINSFKTCIITNKFENALYDWETM